MSHDRKPGRVRIMKADGRTSGRRRADGSAKSAKGGAKSSESRSSGLGTIVLILLFLLAAAGSGAAVEMYLPS